MFSRYKKKLNDNHDVVKMEMLTATFIRMLHYILSEKSEVYDLSEFVNNEKISKKLAEIKYDTFNIIEAYLIIVFARIIARIKSKNYNLTETVPSINEYFSDNWSALSAIAIFLNWKEGTADGQMVNKTFRDDLIANLNRNDVVGIKQIRNIAHKNNFGEIGPMHKITRGSIWVSAIYHSTDYLRQNNNMNKVIKSTLQGTNFDKLAIDVLIKCLTIDIDKFINNNIKATEMFWNIIPSGEKEIASEAVANQMCSIIGRINGKREYGLHLDYSGSGYFL